jgi:glycosyltransferase involved in cell wall biosynthesis
MAAEGLGLLDNTEIFMRSNDEALVAACIQLLLDQVMATAVGNAARARAAALYSRDKIIDKVAALLSSSANDR